MEYSVDIRTWGVDLFRRYTSLSTHNQAHVWEREAFIVIKQLNPYVHKIVADYLAPLPLSSVDVVWAEICLDRLGLEALQAYVKHENQQLSLEQRETIQKYIGDRKTNAIKELQAVKFEFSQHKSLMQWVNGLSDFNQSSWLAIEQQEKDQEPSFSKSDLAEPITGVLDWQFYQSYLNNPEQCDMMLRSQRRVLNDLIVRLDLAGQDRINVIDPAVKEIIIEAQAVVLKIYYELYQLLEKGLSRDVVMAHDQEYTNLLNDLLPRLQVIAADHVESVILFRGLLAEVMSAQDRWRSFVQGLPGHTRHSRSYRDGWRTQLAQMSAGDQVPVTQREHVFTPSRRNLRGATLLIVLLVVFGAYNYATLWGWLFYKRGGDVGVAINVLDYRVRQTDWIGIVDAQYWQEYPQEKVLDDLQQVLASALQRGFTAIRLYNQFGVLLATTVLRNGKPYALLTDV